MRIAFVDLAFAWPPTGGAQTDLYHTIQGIAALGHDVHLFGACYTTFWRFNYFDPTHLPFPSTAMWFNKDTYNRHTMPDMFKKEVDAWKPDIVFMGLGCYLKPYVIHALAEYPIISRYYMYEPLCLRDFCLYDYQSRSVCPCDTIETPNACRICAVKCWWREILSGDYTGYGKEFIIARAYTHRYHRLAMDALHRINLAIVNNKMIQNRLAKVCHDVRVIPGGVCLGEYEYVPREEKSLNQKKVILMSGRADALPKGLKVLFEAGLGLSGLRDDFEIWVTYPGTKANPWDTFVEQPDQYPWLKNVGWHDQAGVARLYQQADIVVAPSTWAEPYGLVAIEAMASGVPVCASRAGGFVDTIVHGETGYLFQPGDSIELALYLERLLNNYELRRQMGVAGRSRVEAHYDWNTIVSQYYPSILEEVARHG